VVPEDAEDHDVMRERARNEGVPYAVDVQQKISGRISRMIALIPLGLGGFGGRGG
jgi:hypothetical protein